jgi:hypothetical protein
MPRPSADCISYEVGMQGHRGGLRVHCMQGIVTVLHRISDAYRGV